ncbi:signal transduction histidine-protein kinase/phosphatase DegS [Lachnospiraceae bacterium]|nr:signal transduction histidine-protein kinase/phosphatase DegS [Lachnospiraceae bacterium]
MEINDVKILQNIYHSCMEDRDDEYERIKENSDRINAIQAFLVSVKDEEDTKIFSPWREEDLYKDKILSYKEEIAKLEKSNRKSYQRIERLNSQIDSLEILIRNIKTDDDEKLKLLDILSIQEKERQRIANDLHDSSIQNLTHLIHTIELSSICIDEDKISAKLELESCIKNLRSIIEEMRQIIFNLRPMSFDDLGFKNGVENFIFNIKSQYKNFIIDYDVCNLERKDWKIDDKKMINSFLILIYRIIQEAVVNAINHSNGEKITLLVKKEHGNCIIEIMDDGKGFHFDKDKEQRNIHYGLLIMEERINLMGGKISINTQKEIGTEIKIVIPMNK